MEKLSITLPQNMVSHVSAQIKAGRCASTSEYIRKALSLKMAQDAEMDLIAKRYAQIDQQCTDGQVSPSEDVFARLKAALPTP